MDTNNVELAQVTNYVENVEIHGGIHFPTEQWVPETHFLTNNVLVGYSVTVEKGELTLMSE